MAAERDAEDPDVGRCVAHTSNSRLDVPLSSGGSLRTVGLLHYDEPEIITAPAPPLTEVSPMPVIPAIHPAVAVREALPLDAS